MTDTPSHSGLQALFAARVEEEIAELETMRTASKGDRAPVALDQQSVGRVSRIDSLQVQAMSNATEARRQLRLRALNAAKTRLQEGEFGYCGECGEFIGLKRLQVDCTAVKCITCAGP